MPVAIYARSAARSTLEELRAYARRQYPKEKALEYVDPEPGHLFDQPGFRRLRDDIRDGRVSAVVTFEADPLTRDLVDAVEAMALILRQGVRVSIPGEGDSLFEARRDRFRECVRAAFPRGGGAPPGNQFRRGRTKYQDKSTVAKILKLRDVDNLAFQAISEKVGVPLATTHRIWKLHSPKARGSRNAGTKPKRRS